MTQEQILIHEMNGIRFEFRDGFPVSSESVIRVFDKMEEWLKKERVPVDLNKPYAAGKTHPRREKLEDEREMPVHSVCYLCRKPIRFVMLTEEERKKYSPVSQFDSLAVYDRLYIHHEGELNGETGWAMIHREKENGWEESILCPECGYKLKKFMEENQNGRKTCKI